VWGVFKLCCNVDKELHQLAAQVSDHLRLKRLVVVTAESCTGGWLAKLLTDMVGSSQWFDRGFVTYSNASKIDLLGVSPAILDSWGAVSEQSARAMAEGARRRGAGNLAVSISGIAGPEGGSPLKPVGTVWFAWSHSAQGIVVAHRRFEGDRASVRRQAVMIALKGIFQFG
jgi:nicotinamide-nucleotide amidase